MYISVPYMLVSPTSWSSCLDPLGNESHNFQLLLNGTHLRYLGKPKQMQGFWADFMQNETKFTWYNFQSYEVTKLESPSRHIGWNRVHISTSYRSTTMVGSNLIHRTNGNDHFQLVNVGDPTTVSIPNHQKSYEIPRFRLDPRLHVQWNLQYQTPRNCLSHHWRPTNHRKFPVFFTRFWNQLLLRGARCVRSEVIDAIKTRSWETQQGTRQQEETFQGACHGVPAAIMMTHGIHIYIYIYLHLPEKLTKCRQICHTWMVLCHVLLILDHLQAYRWTIRSQSPKYV